MGGLSRKEVEFVEGALGRPPRGAIGVAARDGDGWPAVIVVDPLAQGRPFPTLYWLVHPELCREISRIESISYIKALEREVAQNNEFQRRMEEDTRQYQEERLRLLESLHVSGHFPQSYSNSLKTTGIGGLKNPKRVRCLHMHYADYLAQGRNVVGERIERDFSLSKVLTPSLHRSKFFSKEEPKKSIFRHF